MTDKEAKKTLKTMKENIDKKYLKSRNSVAIETVLNLIQTQQAEIEKQSKEKNLIYDFLYKFGSKFSGSFMKELSEDGFDIKKCENCEYETCDCKECIKQYFERKVENEN